MARTAKKNVVKRRRIEFMLEMPEAQQVILMGDFNQWNPKTHPMRKVVHCDIDSAHGPISFYFSPRARVLSRQVVVSC